MESITLVIFGITSNLAQKYLLPSLYDMKEKGLLSEGVKVLGVARRKLTREEFVNYINEALHKENIHHRHPIKNEVLKKLIKKISYLDGNLDDSNFYTKLSRELKHKNTIFYLATYPELYQTIFRNLQKFKLNHSRRGFTRLMIEKPIGNDLNSAKNINQLLTKYFHEDQIYRMDHYLGKETIQNILTFRFANGIFEPLINKDFIDHIQISALEQFGISGRGGYYDKIGALKDVGQNHQLQMLAFATMDAPKEFNNRSITDQRIKIFKNLVPLKNKIVFGQYESYQSEENIPQDSMTDTYYAFKTFIDNDRLKDVPIYIRAGKKIGIQTKEMTEISIVFKQPKNKLLNDSRSSMTPNVLIYRIQPNEGIVVKILTKKSGHEIELQEDYMQFCYRIDPNSHSFPDPYERLLMDTVKGDQTFFTDAEEVEAQWKFIDQLYQEKGVPVIYKDGSWGPKESDQLMKDDGREWLEPSMDFCRI